VWTVWSAARERSTAIVAPPSLRSSITSLFLFTPTPSPAIHTLSLHDALPISCLPREVEGIDGDAVAAEARARAEAHVAERLGCGGIDHLPDVDPHPVAEDGELVDERDVDRAEDVLEQLRQLGRLGAGELVHRVDRAPVEVGGAARALGRDPAEHLRRRLRRPILAPRVDALRGHREEEALARAEAASLLEDRLQHFP